MRSAALRVCVGVCLLGSVVIAASKATDDESEIGREVAIPRHLQEGEEFDLSIPRLLAYGKRLFEARFTSQEGAGRPLTKGTGAALSDPSSPLVFPRNNNRLSGPDSNSCAGCHNQPIGGGTGDLSTNVFVLGQRFDFVTFDASETLPTLGTVDERGTPVTLQSLANSRSTIDMFGAGYYEMLARQITADLQTVRNTVGPGQQAELRSKGISFGVIARNGDGTWNTASVQGLPPQSLAFSDAQHPPSLLILPFHQTASTVSLRVFSNDAFNQHHGMQSTERFGVGTDPDGDGVVNELTRADITAVTLFQAALPVPIRDIPRNDLQRRAAERGEALFREIGCAGCHIPTLPLNHQGWIYTEPGPYNPPGNLQAGATQSLAMDLANDDLPQPRLKPVNGVIWVPLYTDFKLHDICRGPDDPNVEKLNMNAKAGSEAFFAGNSRYLTRRLWAVGSKPNYFHHGQFTTIREAILAHAGEAASQQKTFSALSSYEQGAVIEFLKTLKAPSFYKSDY
jgi:hypothetical protein